MLADAGGDGRRQATGIWMLVAWSLVTAMWWMLALAPVPDPPAWLAVARQVCFGTTDSGLPDTYGWVALFVGPGSLLLGIAGAWGRDIWNDIHQLWRSQAGQVACLAFVTCLAVVFSLVAVQVNKGLAIANTDYGPGDLGALPADYPRLGQELPGFSLQNQHGHPFTDADMQGSTTLLTFAFGHCHTVCPVVVKSVANAVESIDDPSVRAMVITLDPWRDTPNRLHHMIGHWQLPDNSVLLSGPVDDVQQALDGLNVARQRDESSGDVAHPPLVYVVDRDGLIVYAFNNPPVDWLVEAADRLN